MGLRHVLVLGLAIVLAALIHGGIYQIVTAGGGGGGEGFIGDVHAWRVNKFTGSVAFCPGRRCVDVEWKAVQK